MALTVNTNLASLTVQSNLNKASGALQTSMQRLSSGLRINSAKDDAAGLQISNRLTSQINGLGVAIKNANDGSSIAQTAEGAMQQSTNILQSMRTLALQSANGSPSAEDRKSNQAQYAALTAELTRIATTTTFGGKNLLDGSFGTTSFQVGANANQTIDMSIGNVAANNIGSQQLKTQALTPSATGIAGGAVTVTGGGQTATVTLAAGASAKQIAAQMNGAVGGLSATASTEAQFTVNTATIAAATPPSANFTLQVGSGAAVQFTGVTKTSDLADQLKSNAAKLGISVNYDSSTDALSVKSDTGENLTFNAGDGGAAGISVATKDGTGTYGTATALAATAIIATGAVSLNSSSSYALNGPGVAGVFAAGAATAANSAKTTVNNTDITTASNAQNSIDVITQAISDIDSQRAGLGAVQNRFDNTVANLQSIADNSSAARGQIQDVDYAAETAQLTKQQTLQQASTAILSQANQLPSSVLKLLQ
ncbi:branched-chain alpha-keto acid dehydrogenase subunit E2 [Pseudomonas fluorescens]|uniref:Flagellin n=1 Tax=Pseudomonas lactucae TaxID=2813360 RepID=A0A9X0YFZ9_9PSED|nr:MULTISPECIES: flagellin [Pseudomonas]OPA86909.1 branched-chain alpha-keto acid dehydrogenase subunit E2 [Pseudomonas fluorescens]MBN2978521.1 flagellin [Pseudomonas lactucae]MBN2986080.1 flagellin [Pseudomonas lactucae]OPB06483.1 branched-chain alpha-keto acid dehydrogenase subunit E2 [Pseudomonas fluorescens]OPB17767.1 branched-chain alpha-keto acid dehydrogenase subunit E2 [Pseudomonas fluorescens]